MNKIYIENARIFLYNKLYVTRPLQTLKSFLLFSLCQSIVIPLSPKLSWEQNILITPSPKISYEAKCTNTPIVRYCWLLISWTKSTNVRCIPVIFQHLSLTYCKPVVKDQRSFYEIRCLAICVNIKTFNWVNREQLNILKALLEYPECYADVY